MVALLSAMGMMLDHNGRFDSRELGAKFTDTTPHKPIVVKKFKHRNAKKKVRK
jgi:hypothetical protein